MKIAFVTDSGTGKSIEELAEEGIISVPLQISDENMTYQDMENLSKNDLIQLLNEGHVFTTSQPSVGVIEECFESLKDQGTDLIVAVPICNGLSGTISTMTAVANSLDMKIITVDTYVTAVVQEYILLRIKEEMEKGTPDLEINLLVDQIISTTNTLVIPKTLDQLIRGGRMTPLAAKLGKLLRISPVLQINKSTGGRIDTMDKVRTFRKALEKGLDEMEAAGVNDGHDDWYVYIAHVNNITDSEALYHRMAERFPKAHIEIIQLCSPVACHTGLGSICLQWFRKL